MARVIAIGFAAGAAVHAAAFALMLFGVDLYGPGYPAWRHAVMATIDASVAWLGWRQQRWLFVALPAWAAEQTLVNGFGVFPVVALIGVVALTWERWRSTRQRAG